MEKPSDTQYEDSDEPTEVVKVHNPVMTFSGECVHEYNYATPRVDSDGMYQVRCQKCPMGKLLTQAEYAERIV